MAHDLERRQSESTSGAAKLLPNSQSPYVRTSCACLVLCESSSSLLGMSGEAWAIVGVVVGAIVGGGAQVVAQLIDHRVTRRTRHRDELRIAYVGYVSTLRRVQTLIHRVASESTTMDDLVNEEDIDALRGYSSDLDDALSVLQISAPPDTYEAAWDIFRASQDALAPLLAEGAEMSEPDWSQMSEARREFTRLAKRDLALD